MAKADPKESFVERLRHGKLVLGTAITQASPFWWKLAKELPLDFVFLDHEHIPFSRSELAGLCRAFDAMAVVPIVRIPRPDPILACTALDGGAGGIVAPYVETRGQVLDLVGAVKYAPLKGTVLSEGLANDNWASATKAYLDRRNRDRCAIINIESLPALDHLSELISVPGLDAVLIGPHDLSISLGAPEDYEQARFLECLDRIVEAARAQGIGAGIHAWWGVETAGRWIEKGLNMLVHGSDYVAARSRLAEDLEALGRKGS